MLVSIPYQAGPSFWPYPCEAASVKGWIAHLRETAIPKIKLKSNITVFEFVTHAKQIIHYNIKNIQNTKLCENLRPVKFYFKSTWHNVTRAFTNTQPNENIIKNQTDINSQTSAFQTMRMNISELKVNKTKSPRFRQISIIVWIQFIYPVTHAIYKVYTPCCP